MTNMIRTPDGKNHWITKDSHFQELLRDYIGQEAADWYESRIIPIDNIHEQIFEIFPTHASMVDVCRALDRLTSDQLRELLATLDELRGWDEQ